MENRRNRLDLMTTAELSILNAIQEVEKVGADVRLTTVITKLSNAKDSLSDFIDEVGTKKGFVKNVLVDFGEATRAAKKGKRIARKGWNGSGMFAYIVPAASYPVQTEAAKKHFGENALVPYREYWALKTAQDDIATWAPSGSDSLAEDWLILKD